MRPGPCSTQARVTDVQMTPVERWDGKVQEIKRWDLVTALGTESDNLDKNEMQKSSGENKAKQKEWIF